jgi:hypothetical protein
VLIALVEDVVMLPEPNTNGKRGCWEEGSLVPQICENHRRTAKREGDIAGAEDLLSRSSWCAKYESRPPPSLPDRKSEDGICSIMVASGGATLWLCSHLTTQPFGNTSLECVKSNLKFVQTYVFDNTSLT